MLGDTQVCTGCLSPPVRVGSLTNPSYLPPFLQTEEETLLHVEVGSILQEDIGLASCSNFNLVDIGMFALNDNL